MHVQTLEKNSNQSSEASGKRPRPAAADPQPPKRVNFDYKPWRAAMAVAITTAAVAMLGADRETELIEHAQRNFDEANLTQMNAYHAWYCATDVLQRLSTIGTLDDRPRVGRNALLTDNHLDDMIDVLVGGFMGFGGKNGELLWWGYTSFAHAYNSSAKFKELVDETGHSERHLWRQMQERHHKRFGAPLNRITVQFKKVISDEVKQERLQAAHDWLGKMKDIRGSDWLERVIWMDEKQSYISPGGSYHCYASHGTDSMQRECPNGELPRTKVKWMLATSAILGTPYFAFTTGTTGKPLLYKVHTCVPAWTDQHPACCTAHAPCCADNVELALCVFVADTQDVEA